MHINSSIKNNCISYWLSCDLCWCAGQTLHQVCLLSSSKLSKMQKWWWPWLVLILEEAFKFPSWIDTLFHRQRQSTAGDVDWETVTCCRCIDALQIQRATVAFKTISCWCEPPVVSCLIFLETILFDSGNALMDHWPSISPLLLLPSFFMCLFNASLKRSFFHRVFSLQSWILHKTHIWGFCCQTYDTHDRLIEQSCFRHIYFHAKVASGTGEPVCNFLDDSRICCNKGRIIGKE